MFRNLPSPVLSRGRSATDVQYGWHPLLAHRGQQREGDSATVANGHKARRVSSYGHCDVSTRSYAYRGVLATESMVTYNGVTGQPQVRYIFDIKMISYLIFITYVITYKIVIMFSVTIITIILLLYYYYYYYYITVLLLFLASLDP